MKRNTEVKKIRRLFSFHSEGLTSPCIHQGERLFFQRVVTIRLEYKKSICVCVCIYIYIYIYSNDIDTIDLQEDLKKL